MKILRALFFLILVIVFSLPVFQFFQLNPGYFPVPDFSADMWDGLSVCCGLSSYEDKQDFQFLLTVLISVAISAVGVSLACALVKRFKRAVKN